MTNDYLKLGSMRSIADFRSALAEYSIPLPVDDDLQSAPQSPLASTFTIFGKQAPNRFAVHPMEGWDGTLDGKPTDYTVRRWRRFGDGGAGLIWGGEAVAVCPAGRANTNQLMINADNLASIADLRTQLLDAYQEANGSSTQPVVGLQLTHSGRFCRPNPGGKLEPRTLYRHPILERKAGLDGANTILTDLEIGRIIEDFVQSAKYASDCGFDFVDIKHCHGYLGHEFLSAYTRKGPYGGSFESRTRFLREIVAGIKRETPGLGIGVRLSAFDLVPYEADPGQSQPGEPGPGLPANFCDAMPYKFAFGVNGDQPTEYDLSETVQFLNLLVELGVDAVNLTAGSPYYNPHIQRPALYPPSDGYAPPEDPLIGAARQIFVVRQLKELCPKLTMVGTAYSYFQDFLPNVAQAVVREGWVDFVGLGRMVLSYPEMPREILSGSAVTRKKVCRTFSDCTTAPRNHMRSGCYPLDTFYKKSDEGQKLVAWKRANGKA
ncbi:MAG: NADH:flavin oxidoreductase [Chthonomonadales bacterium]